MAGEIFDFTNFFFIFCLDFLKIFRPGVFQFHEKYLIIMFFLRMVKPIVAWCIGTCSDMFTTDVQFGHAGASAGAEAETATFKNKALESAGAIVPKSFDDFGKK